LNDELVKLAYEWQTSFQSSNKNNKSKSKSKNGKQEQEKADGEGHDYHDHPTEPVGDPAVVSTALITKWGRYFSACDDDDGAM
jgi:hypothetical protein